MSEEKVCFRHIYIETPRGTEPIATLASAVHQTPEIVRVAISRCHSHNDQFSKKVGRVISAQRLRNCQNRVGFVKSFKERIEVLFGPDAQRTCVLFEVEEIPALIQAVREESQFRYPLNYRELCDTLGMEI